MPEALMLGVSLVIALTIAILSYNSSEAAHAARQQQDLTLEIERLNADLLSDLTDAETGQRGFLLTGQDRYLDPYTKALTTIPQTLDGFRTVTAVRPDQAARVEMLAPLVSQKLAELKNTIDLRRENKAAEAVAIVNTDRGQAYMEEIRSICGEIERTAAGNLKSSQTAAEKSASTLRAVSVGGSLILAAFLVVCTIGIFRGITRREELVRRAVASEKLIATTLSGIADGVIATDEKAHITFINPVAQKLTGWTQTEAAGAHINQVFAIVNETTGLKIDNPLEQALRHGEAVRLANHTDLISKSGVQRPIDDSAAPLKDEDGNIIGAVLVFRDISERREADKQLRSANSELQQFVDAAAHDLRSPLNTVNVMAELLEHQFRNQLGPKGSELIGHVTNGIGRMRRLLDDLLAFARASHFNKEAAAAISLDAPLRSVSKTYRPKSKAPARPLPPSLCPSSPSMRRTRSSSFKI